MAILAGLGWAGPGLAAGARELKKERQERERLAEQKRQADMNYELKKQGLEYEGERVGLEKKRFGLEGQREQRYKEQDIHKAAMDEKNYGLRATRVRHEGERVAIERSRANAAREAAKRAAELHKFQLESAKLKTEEQRTASEHKQRESMAQSAISRFLMSDGADVAAIEDYYMRASDDPQIVRITPDIDSETGDKAYTITIFPPATMDDDDAQPIVVEMRSDQKGTAKEKMAALVAQSVDPEMMKQAATADSAYAAKARETLSRKSEEIYERLSKTIADSMEGMNQMPQDPLAASRMVNMAATIATRYAQSGMSETEAAARASATLAGLMRAGRMRYADLLGEEGIKENEAFQAALDYAEENLFGEAGQGAGGSVEPPQNVKPPEIGDVQMFRSPEGRMVPYQWSGREWVAVQQAPRPTGMPGNVPLGAASP